MRLAGMASTRWIDAGVLGVVQGDVAEQGVDRGEPVVAGGHAVVPVVLEVVQERGDQRGVEVGDVQGGRALAGAFGGEAEQKAQAASCRRRWCWGWRRAGR